MFGYLNRVINLDIQAVSAYIHRELCKYLENVAKDSTSGPCQSIKFATYVSIED